MVLSGAAVGGAVMTDVGIVTVGAMGEEGEGASGLLGFVTMVVEAAFSPAGSGAFCVFSPFSLLP